MGGGREVSKDSAGWFVTVTHLDTQSTQVARGRVLQSPDILRLEESEDIPDCGDMVLTQLVHHGLLRQAELLGRVSQPGQTLLELCSGVRVTHHLGSSLTLPTA